MPAREAAVFAVLARPRRAADAFAAVRPGSGPFGANPALARSVSEPRGQLSSGLVSVVPAHGAVCLRVPIGRDIAQWWCQPLAAATRGGLLAAIRPAGPLRASDQLIVGLVPDGVRNVLITSADGAAHLIAVRHNVYDAQIYAPQKVSITLARPRHRAATPRRSSARHAGPSGRGSARRGERAARRRGSGGRARAATPGRVEACRDGDKRVTGPPPGGRGGGLRVHRGAPVARWPPGGRAAAPRLVRAPRAPAAQ